MHLVKLIDSILEHDLVPVLGVYLDSQAVVVDVRREDNFRPMYHEEQREAGGSTRCGSKVQRTDGSSATHFA